MPGDRDDEASFDATLLPEAAGIPAATPSTLDGYTLGRTIGTGGMGTVALALDHEIRREVAVKRLLAEDPPPALTARFLREARIQARLEHPAIVPVYELGRDPKGRPYFTMKRVAGRTLGEQFETEPSLQALLRTFVDVCLAIDFAHARGVIHRDLKPANVMLGDFGEVYVLDWGIARIVDETEAVAAAGDIATLDGKTEAGAVLGTPGYMAPEQIEGAANVGPQADVYSLGTILFELLAGDSAHPRGPGVLASTLGGKQGTPAKRAPDRAIPPELDELCLEAMALEPAERPTARQLADGVQRFLDGDRDLEQRRSLAAESLRAAQAALAAGDAGRPDAIRAAGRALALDPQSRDAAALITRLMLEPPVNPPPGLAAELAQSEAAVQQRQSHNAVRALAVTTGFLLLAAASGVTRPWLVAVTASWGAFVTFLSWRASRHHASTREMLLLAFGNAILAAGLSRMFGSLLIAPAVTAVMAVSLTSYPQLIRHAKIVIPMLIASWLVPVALEQLGVFGKTWMVHDGFIESRSAMLVVEGTPTQLVLVLANVVAIAVVGLFANAMARSRRDAQHRVEVQAWQLRHLLPED